MGAGVGDTHVIGVARADREGIARGKGCSKGDRASRLTNWGSAGHREQVTRCGEFHIVARAFGDPGNGDRSIRDQAGVITADHTGSTVVHHGNAGQSTRVRNGKGIRIDTHGGGIAAGANCSQNQGAAANRRQCTINGQAVGPGGCTVESPTSRGRLSARIVP